MRQKGVVYQLKITLKHIRPPIWRRILVASDTTLQQLHIIIQIILDWENYHLYQFSIGNVSFGDPELAVAEGFDMIDAARMKLHDIVHGEKQKFEYVYDFGDYWQHEILVEKILPLDRKVKYPLCIKGKRSGPPEDCGGPYGYLDLIEIIQDPQHEEHEEMLEWLGGEFEPDAFDLDGINTLLKINRGRTQ